MSALSKPDRSKETAKTAAPSKPPEGGRPTFRRCLALFAVFCVAAALLPAAASAHDPTTTRTEKQKRESYQVEVGEERVIDYYQRVRVEPKWITIPAYNYTNVPQYEDVVTMKFVGNKKVRIPPYTKSERVAPFTKTVPVYGNKLTVKCTELVYGDPKSRICWPETVRVQTGTKTVPAYNYKQVPAYNYTNIPQYEDVVTKKFVGNKKVRIPPYTKSQEVFNYEQQPVYKTVKKYETRYRMVGTGEYETTTTHTPHTCTPPKVLQGHDDCVDPPDPTPDPVSCPTGYQTLATLPTTVQRPGSNEEAKVATEQQIKDNPGMVNYAVHQQRLNATSDCYTLVYPEILESDFDLLGVIIDGVTWFYKEGEKFVENGVEYVVKGGKRALEIAEDYVLSPAEEAAKAAVDAAIKALETTDRFLETALCNYVGGAIVIVSTTSPNLAANPVAVRTLSAAALATAGSTATIAGIAVAAAVLGYCAYKANSGSDDSDDDDSGGSVPAPASGLSASAGAGQIAVSWSASATVPAAGFGYRVQWKPAADAWGGASAGSADLDHGSDLATSYTITGLVNGSAYDVRVAAFNADGVSDWITGQTTPAKPKPEPKPSLAFDSVSCASSGSGWVISVTWSKTPETLKPDIWANEAKNRGHRGFQTAVAGTSTTFDVPNAGWYQVGMQAKIAGNKKVGDDEPVRCR